MNYKSSIMALAVATLLGVEVMCSAQASVLFDGKFASYWLVNPDTGEITSYSAGEWLEGYSSAIHIPVGNEQVLVNQLASSSVPMSATMGASQGAVSLIGLNGASKMQGESGPLSINVLPTPGEYEQTVNVIMQANVATSVADTLRYRKNAGTWNSISLSEQNIASLALIENGSYAVEVQLLMQGALIDSASANYTVNNLSPFGKRRDTDNDGIPDAIEAELGLNPLEEDASFDSDNDGWSDIDTWLRCGVTTKNEADASECKAMKDEDGDGWATYDEELRGTNPNDKSPVISGVSEGSVSSQKAQQRYKDFPSARRLYEPEYIIKGSQTDLVYRNLSASSYAGEAYYSLDKLLTNTDLQAVGMLQSELDSRLLQDTAIRALQNKELPELRIPTSDGVFIRGQSPNTQADIYPVRLGYLPQRGDVHFREFMQSAGTWETSEKWRTSLKSWLQTQLVIPVQVDLNADTSVALLMFEQSLIEEAARQEQSTDIALGNGEKPLKWLPNFVTSLQSRFNSDLVDGDVQIEDEHAVSMLVLLQDALAANKVQLSDERERITAWINEWSYSQRANVSLRHYLTDRLANASADMLENSMPECFISDYELALLQENADAFAEFEARCPNYYSGSDIENARAIDSQTRMRMRLAIIPKALNALATFPTLGERDTDTDNDGLSNFDELYDYAISNMPLAWVSDTDDDSLLDGSDPCPVDALDICTGELKQQTVSLDETQALEVERSVGDTSLMTSFVLARPAEIEVCVDYKIQSISGSPSLEENSRVCFNKGQQVALIPITLPQNEQGDGAQLLLSLVGSAQAHIDAQVLKINFSPAPQVEQPEAIILASTTSVDERGIVSLDGSTSVDPEGGQLSYMWAQTDGITISTSSATAPNLILEIPEVLAQSTVEFTLTVINTNGAQNSAQVSVTILPVEDAPRQLSVLRFTLSTANNTIISNADLLSAVEEPDGDPLFVGQMTGLPTGIDVQKDAASFTLATSGEGGERELARRSSRDLRAFGDGFAFLTMSGKNNDPFGIWTYTDTKGLQQVAEAENTEETFSGLLSAAHSDVLYYDKYSQETSSQLVYRLHNDEVTIIDTEGFAGIFGSAIGHAGQLYQCGYSGNWKIAELESDKFVDSGYLCNRYASSVVVFEDETCLTSEDQVICTQDGSTKSLSPIYDAPTGTIELGRMYKVGDKLLITRSYSRDTNTSLTEVIEFSYLNLDGQQSVLGESELNAFGMGVIVIKDGFILVGQHNTTKALMAYKVNAGNKWSELNNNLIEAFVDPNDNVSFYGLTVLDGQVYVEATINYSETKLFTFTTESPNEVVNISPENYSGPAEVFGERLMLPIGKGGEGKCNWHEKYPRETMNPVPLIEDANCFTALKYDDKFVFSRYVDEIEGSSYSIYSSGVSPGIYPVQVAIDDTKGNLLNMQVELEILPGTQP